MLLFGFAIVILFVLSVWCLGRIRREYRHAQNLSVLSVVIVWGLYLLHFFTTVAASIVEAWPYIIASDHQLGSRHHVDSGGNGYILSWYLVFPFFQTNVGFG